MNYLGLSLVILLSGCASNVETTYSQKTPYAPVNEINGGVVSYFTDGFHTVVENRRKDAYKKMYDQCGGPYKIVDEGENVGSTVATPAYGAVYYNQVHTQKIKFECVKGT